MPMYSSEQTKMTGKEFLWYV